ncbi:MAG: tRNA pseudouridine(54/55) synthase Pus10, partial [Candidatus Thorarchaeota archaeon]
MGNTDKRNLLDIAEQMLSKYPLCDQCLGRQFAWLSTDTSNRERGRSIKLLLSMQADEQIKSGDREGGLKILTELAGNGSFGPAGTLIKKNGIDPPSTKGCHLCLLEERSVFGRTSEIAERIIESTKNIEFATFLIGCIPVPTLAEREEELRALFSLLRGEPLKSDFNRELGKQVQKALGKEADFEHSDIVIVYNMIRDTLDIQINPIFVYGRYRKLVRGIPQSRWDCTACGGRGCESCGGTGRRYPDSIAEYVGIPVQSLAQGAGFKFHGAGREDIDALMLGSGRPFVV